MNTLNIKCDCGELRGEVRNASPARINRGVCYCTDCQAFARHLGRGDLVLDEYGGTEILQFSSGQLEFSQGEEHLACLQLTDGALRRWYASCCNTPIGNTLGKSWIPFVGLLRASVDPALSEAQLDQLAGPNRLRVHTQGALKDADRLAANAPGQWSMLLGLLRLLGGGWLRGEHRRSPFFDNGAPVKAASVLSAEELVQAKRIDR